MDKNNEFLGDLDISYINSHILKEKVTKLEKNIEVESEKNAILKEYVFILESKLIEQKDTLNNYEKICNENNKLKKDYNILSEKYNKLLNEMLGLKKFKKEVINSKSWKITEPLRKLTNKFK